MFKDNEQQPEGFQVPLQEALDNLDTVRAQLSRARDLRFLVYILSALLLVLIGVLFLLSNFDLFDWLDWGRFWPLLIIVPGLLLIVGRLRGA